ncbi:MAG: sodium/solute symporter [Acidimicrobiia bacterium]|nr:sodium/solute symporter [Acidimicrobiia bacterium]
MGLTTLDLVVIVAYMASLSLIGLYFSKRQTSRDEYLLGDRNMHWLLIGGSVMATMFSTITFLSMPGEMIRYGIAYFSGALAIPLIIPVVNRVLIPMLRSLPITSAYEYLERRFDVRFRTLAATVFVFRTLVWMGLIIYTCSFAVAQITGWDLYLTIFVTGVITTFYTAAGGMRTVVWTDNLQLVVLMGGAIAVPLVVGFSLGSGPASWWETFSAAGRTHIETFSWDPTVRITIVGTIMAQFFWNICTHGSDQVAVQRYLSTPTLEAARKSVWVYVGLNLAIIVLLVLCGLALFAFYAHQSSSSPQAFQQEIAARADRVMPLFIVRELHSGVSGLVLAALLAAAMSSLSSGINSVSGVVFSDFISRFGFFKHKSHTLAIDKVISSVAGIVGVLNAEGIAVTVQATDWNLVEMTSRLNHIFVGPLGVLFFAGILLRRAGKQAAILGFALATLVSLFICFGRGWFGMEKSVSFLWVVPIPFLLGLGCAALCAFLFAPPDKEAIRSLVAGGQRTS